MTANRSVIMGHYLLFYDVVRGLVTEWRVRRWTTVVGEGCATPVRPGDG